MEDSYRTSTGELFTKAFTPETYMENFNFSSANSTTDVAKKFLSFATEARPEETKICLGEVVSPESALDNWYNSELDGALDTLSIDPEKLALR